MSPLSCTLALLCLILAACVANDPPGHLQPLGSHRPPDVDIDALKTIPSPQEFFNNYVLPGKPLLFKGAAKNMPAFKLWTDEYLSNKFGSLKMDVEEGKKENRSWGTFNFKLQDFIKKYKKEDIYMVESLPRPMREDYMLLKSLSCGGFTRVLQDAVMWFSSGGTKSVLHFDAVENINCLFNGHKNLIMIDKQYMPLAHIDRADGSFSNVDVEKVDMYKYPGLGKVPWKNASMEEGDCFYIPYKWIHQVRSFGSRNLAVNIWWAHFTYFNTTDCETSPYKDKEFVPLSDFELKSEESIRQEVLESLGRQPVNKEQWVKSLQEIGEKLTLLPSETKLIEENFVEVDANKDGLVTADEIMDIPNSAINRLLSGGAMDAEGGDGEEDEGPPGPEGDENAEAEQDVFKDEL